MNKCIKTIIILLLISLLISGCVNKNHNPNKTTLNTTQTALQIDSTEEMDSKDEEIYDSPVDLVAFNTLDEFCSYTLSAKVGDDVADLFSLKTFYLPPNIPKDYLLYKITAGIADIGFWYMPKEYLTSQDKIFEGEASNKHFLFISARETYDFKQILLQHNGSKEDLIESKFFIREIGQVFCVYWEEDNNVFILDLPEGYEPNDLNRLCTLNKYTRNSNKQSFDVE